MYKNIQMLRAVAAVSVMLFHGAAVHQEAVGQVSWLMTCIARFGYAGVDLFFVISGFVAAHTTLYRERSVADSPQYVYKRLARIYLGYWPFYGLSLVVAAVYKPALLDQWHWLHSFFLAFLIGVNEGRELVLYVSWSLTYELLFYSLVAMSFAMKPRRSILALQIATPVLAIGMIMSLSRTMPLALWTFLAFLLEFFLGAVIRTKVHLIRGKWAAMMAIALIFIGFRLGFREDTLQAAERALSIGLGCAGLTMLALVAEQSRCGIAPRWSIALGSLSEILCVRHTMSPRSMYAKQDKEGRSRTGAANHTQRNH